ncbi:unnamed protein product [Spirodela intermedia]|uniref:Uncharacterized protein n=1 Tax=Spirodela intermedia TaxID=51605 RepID=A0A7I8IPE4_SPIIN|nr:unnamed protein product [Spirodela intermedia]CAA6659739.1 unnamed protein product [Spirodela intermedia]
MVEAAVQFSPTKPPGQWGGEAKEQNPASIATMMSTSSCVEKIFNTASGGRRSSLDLQRLDDEKEESEVSIVPAKNVANGIEASKGSPAQIAPGTNAHYLVVKTLRTFNRHYLHFVQVTKGSGILVNASMLKVDEGEDQIKKRGSKRPDLKAISKNMFELRYPTFFESSLAMLSVLIIFFK